MKIKLPKMPRKMKKEAKKFIAECFKSIGFLETK